jgi:phosphoglycerate-specific signal transduction histidine kinase
LLLLCPVAVAAAAAAAALLLPTLLRCNVLWMCCVSWWRLRICKRFKRLFVVDVEHCSDDDLVGGGGVGGFGGIC